MPKDLELSRTETPAAKTARVAVLGTLRLDTPELSIDSFGSRHAATILAILALHPEPISRSRLATEIWPGEDEEVLRPRLRQEIFRLKKALGDWAHLVTADREFVALRRLCVSTDVEEFLSLVQAGRGVEGARRIEFWSLAANLYKDDVLVDYDGDWLNHERASLQGIRRRLLLNLIPLLVENGRALDAVAHARLLVRQDPFDESSHCALAQAMHAAGDTSAAREHLRRTEARLKGEGRYRGESLAKAWKIINTAVQAQTSESDPEIVVAEPSAAMRRPLPVPLHKMFGRESEIEKLLGLFLNRHAESGRLVTIIGFGGMGKTRLAVEVARRMSEGGPNLVGFVSLIEVEDPDVLIQNIAAVVCPVREQSQDLYSTIAAQLEGREATLVLDNFEDLVPVGNLILERLLQENPSLRLLVTSRTPLGILGEQLFPLSPLPLPSEADSEADLLASPSVALFLDQALRVRPDFVLDAASLACIVSLIGAVEGIPLAILLAACRMRALSAREAEKAIQDRLAFLSGPKGGFEPRHRTMRACIEWSSESLPPGVRRFWIKLACFHGGWSLEAAQTILGEPYAMDYLEMLCDSSLVHRQQIGSNTRYAMFEPVRQFAEELLEPEERDRLHPVFARYFVEFLEEASVSWFVGERGATFESVETDMDNIRSALAWSLSHSHENAQRIGVVLRSFWLANGHHAEGRVWLDRILALPEGSWNPQQRILMMLTNGIIAMDQADFDRARQLYSEARATCVALGDESGRAWVDLNMAHIDVLFGYVGKAKPVQEAALEVFERIGNPTGTAHAMTDLGRSLLCLGDSQKALFFLQRALAIRMEVGWENGTAFAEEGLGNGLLKLGHLIQSYEHLDAARDICRRIKDARILIDDLADISDCCLELGRLEESASALALLRDLCRRVGDGLGTVYCDIRAAMYELVCGKTSTSMEFARKALNSAIRLGIPMATLEALRVFAAISRRLATHETTLFLAFGIENVRITEGIATWPRRTREIDLLVASALDILEPSVVERIKAKSSEATLDTLQAAVERLEHSSVARSSLH